MAKLGKSGRPPAIYAIKSYCRGCVNWNRIDCDIPWCPLYYWFPYSQQEPDTSWVEANAYSDRYTFAAWEKQRKEASKPASIKETPPPPPPQPKEEPKKVPSVKRKRNWRGKKR